MKFIIASKAMKNRRVGRNDDADFAVVPSDAQVVASSSKNGDFPVEVQVLGRSGLGPVEQVGCI